MKGQNIECGSLQNLMAGIFLERDIKVWNAWFYRLFIAASFQSGRPWKSLCKKSLAMQDSFVRVDLKIQIRAWTNNNNSHRIQWMRAKISAVLHNYLGFLIIISLECSVSSPAFAHVLVFQEIVDTSNTKGELKTAHWGVTFLRSQCFVRPSWKLYCCFDLQYEIPVIYRFWNHTQARRSLKPSGFIRWNKKCSCQFQKFQAQKLHSVPTIIFHLSNLWKTRFFILCDMCYISGEAAGEIWNGSLLRVEGTSGRPSLGWKIRVSGWRLIQQNCIDVNMGKCRLFT